MKLGIALSIAVSLLGARCMRNVQTLIGEVVMMGRDVSIYAF